MHGYVCVCVEWSEKILPILGQFLCICVCVYVRVYVCVCICCLPKSNIHLFNSDTKTENGQLQ